jgi:hypothetical protein
MGIFFFQFCEVTGAAIIYKKTEPNNLATGQRGERDKKEILALVL